VPLAHLTGRQDFMGQVLLASPAALVPRRETEQLGYAAVDRLQSLAVESPLVVDVCTGAGNVALGIAAHVNTARVFGADLSEEAIDLARDNARFIGREDVEFRAGDLLNPFNETPFHKAVDVLTCNPPYISSTRVETLHHEISRHEPSLAFDGGPFGVGIIRRFLKEAPDYLKPGGWLLMEIGAGQGASVAKSLAGNPRYDEVNTYSDANGEIRVVEARCAAQPGE
jgi:release factor glutamine methyltransferase